MPFLWFQRVRVISIRQTRQIKGHFQPHGEKCKFSRSGSAAGELGKLGEAAPKFLEFDLALDDGGAKRVDDVARGFARETFVGEAFLLRLDVFFQAVDFFFQARDFGGLVHRVAIGNPQIKCGRRANGSTFGIQMIR